ncbi:MAG: argininosuccinate lyase [Promethearchaeota archaeon]
MGKDFYRSRLDDSLEGIVLQFLSSLEEDLWIVEEDIIGTEVHNIMLHEQGILDKKEIKQILMSLETIKKKFIKNEMVLDPSFEDIHPFIEKCVINDIGMDIGGKLHTGRSRNDQVSVDIRLKIRNELNQLASELLEFIDVLLQVSENSLHVFMPLYTHLQRGQLGIFSHYINNYISQILRNLKRIDEIYKRINLNPLGACAIGGTSINIDRKRTAELLGFDGVIENSIDAVSSRDYIYETLSFLSLLSIQFSRIAEDLIIWASKEFGFIELDDKYCSVSSVMPQKKNPDTLELIRSKSSKIVANQFNASLIIKAIPSGYCRDFQELKMPLKSSFDISLSIVDMFKGIFSSFKINKEKLNTIIEDSYILALDVAEILVKEYLIPFRQAHEIVALVVKQSKNPGELLNKDKIQKAIHDIAKKKIELSDDFIDSIRNLETCLTKRISQGSPSPKEIKALLETFKKEKKSVLESISKRIERIKNTDQKREDLIKKLIV